MTGLDNMPWMTCSAPSRPMVAMQPAITKSSGRKVVRASTSASIASRRASMASASSTSGSVHSSSSMLASSSWRVRSRWGSAFSASVGSPGSGWMRPKRAVALQSTSGIGSAHFQRVANSSSAVVSFFTVMSVSSAASSSQTPFSWLIGEEITQHRAAGGLVGVDAYEARHGRARRHPLLGQQALHLPCTRAVTLACDTFPHCPLAGVIGGDRKGLQGLQIDLVGAVGVEQLGRGVPEPQPLLDDAPGDAEARGDGGDGDAGLGEVGEHDDLVGGVHRLGYS